MKKLLFAASALVLTAAMSPAVTNSAQAASAKSPYCNMAKTQRNLVAWNSYYHCLDTAAPAAQVAERGRTGRVAVRAQAEPAKDPYCNMAKTQRNLVAWNAYYHCLGPAPRAAEASVQGRPLYAQAQLPPPAKDPYCNLAKTQRNLVAWNAYYHCLDR